jgi:hypothetical protein
MNSSCDPPSSGIESSVETDHRRKIEPTIRTSDGTISERPKNERKSPTYH